MGYSVLEIERMLKSMVILVDTREQATERLEKRLDDFNCPYERVKLDFGDYSAAYTDSDGETKTIQDIAVIERKMSLDELATCFTKERARFEREFIRAYEKGCRTYLLVEGATWEKVFNGTYRSRLNSESLIASLLAWSIRYDIRVMFCREASTGKLIQRILHRELKEHLES